MNTGKKNIISWTGATFVALLFVGALNAQTATAPVSPSAVEQYVVPFITSFAQDHAWLATVIMVVGSLRLVAKPIVSAVELYVKNTPSPADDEWVNKVEASKAWKVVWWLLDFTTSIKAGSQFTAKPKE